MGLRREPHTKCVRRLPFGTKKGGGWPTRSDFSITADTSNSLRSELSDGLASNWMFTTDKARAKMGRAYPKLDAKSASSQRVKTSVRGTRALLRSLLPHYASQTVFERADQIIKNRSLAGGENHVRGHSS